MSPFLSERENSASWTHRWPHRPRARHASVPDDVRTKLSTLLSRWRLTATILVFMHPKSETCKWLSSKYVCLLIAEGKDTQQTQNRPQSNTATPNLGAYVSATRPPARRTSTYFRRPTPSSFTSQRSTRRVKGNGFRLPVLPLWPCSSTSCGGGLQAVRRRDLLDGT